MRRPAQPSNEPVLWDETNRVPIDLGGRERFLVGRTETADLPVADLACSRRHFWIVKRGDQYFLEPVSETVPTYCDGREVHESTQLAHGNVVQAGLSRFRFLQTKQRHGLAGLSFESHTVFQADSGLQPCRENIVKRLRGPIALPNGVAVSLGRDASRCTCELPHPLVSRRHAEVIRRGHEATIRDLRSANGVYLNGCAVDHDAVLSVGDGVEIGPYVLRFDGESLIPTASRQNNVELTAVNLRRQVENPNTGQSIVILDDISLCVRPREFACILGAAGAGKSTLLQALSGRATPQSGRVFINRRELLENFDQFKHDLAVVPQRDCVHELLTVAQAWQHTARVRLPVDTSEAEIEGRIRVLLEIVGLTNQAKFRIRDLSGGQRKRAMLGDEIIAEPSLLFLDEVTSGLDELTDREMMKLFREMAEQGKTVICITHMLANVERFCHLLIVLAPGGTLAFVGSPEEALRYFGIACLSEVYDALATKPPNEWKNAFLASEFHDRYVSKRLAESRSSEDMGLDDSTPLEPDHSLTAQLAERLDKVARALPTQLERRVKPLIWRLGEFDSTLIEQWFHQAYWLSRRQFRLLYADKGTLAMWGTQCLTVAGLLVSVFGDVGESEPMSGYVQTLTFFLAVSSYWFGCNNSAKQIVGERAILEREQAAGLSPSSYWMSKFVTLGLMTVGQTLILYLIVVIGSRLPGAGMLQAGLPCLLALAGLAVGLAISVIARTEEEAISWVPIILIPQILLAGLIAPLNGWSRLLAKAAVTSYWGRQTLLASLPARFGESPDRFQGTAMIVGHLTLAALIAIVILHYRNRRNATRH